MVSQSDLPLESRTLDPLPPALKHGLVAVSFFGFLSFLSSFSLFCFLTYKLVSWRMRGHARQGYNQFVLLIYNLVLADIQQALAFLLTTRWLVENKIHVGTSTCWANGWFVSTGDLGSGVWIMTIAIHTFFALIVGYKLPYRTFCIVLVALWVFVYVMAIIGAVSHPNDFYTRAGAWCWINEKYQNERLWLHYFWIFIAMFGTITIYAIIFVFLRRSVRSRNPTLHPPQAIARHGLMNPVDSSRVARYMLVYPSVYVICTLPLAASRMSAMTGRTISYSLYCVAGSMITSCGWLDVLIYACTRRVLIFSDSPPAPDNLGIDTFGIWADNGYWGNTTSIEGGILSRGDAPSREGRKVSSRQGSMDDLFGAAVPGKVSTKTTVQVSSHQAVLSPHPDGGPGLGGGYPGDGGIGMQDLRHIDSKENLWSDDKSGNSGQTLSH